MRYAVFCGEVKVYESDLECDVRVLVDDTEVYSLTGTPTFEPNEEGWSRVPTGGSTTATYTDAKGKPVKVLDKEWTP
jgi:hypothetical protein